VGTTSFGVGAAATAVRDGGKLPTATPYPQAQASLAKYVGLIAR
jgi:hypothetical protein